MRPKCISGILTALLVSFAAVTPAAADALPVGDSYMLTDNWGGAWSDAEKSPTNTEDDMMCWAAAAANVLEWTGWGKVGGMTTADQTFSYFLDHWTDVGGGAYYAWRWWFDGRNEAAGWPGWSQLESPGGGFYDLATFYGNSAADYSSATSILAIDNYLRQGYGVAARVYHSGGGHFITCWGVNYDPAIPTYGYRGIWVTDSDDSKSLDNPPDSLRYYQTELVNGAWYLRDFHGVNDWYITSVHGLKVMPEPASSILLLAGFAALRAGKAKACPRR